MCKRHLAFLKTLPGRLPGKEALIASFALLMVGCASMAPPNVAVPLPVSAAYPVTPEHPAGAPEANAAALSWQAFLTDAQLRALVQLALDNNRDLRVAVARVEQSRARYGIQRADLFPSVGLNADGSNERVPHDLSLTGQPEINHQYQAGVGFNTWELDFWGRIRSLRDAALDNYLASDAGRRAVELSVISEVADAYLQLRELDERLALAHRTVETREASLAIFTRRVAVGSTSQLDLTQVQSLLQQAHTLVAQLEQSRAVQVHALEMLVGKPVDLRPEASRSDTSILAEMAPGLPSDLLINRPDIVQAEYLLKASNANIGAARAAFFPRIVLTGSAGTASAELDNLFAAGSGAWNFAPSISLPIFDAGRNRSNLALAQAQREETVAQYEQSIQAAFRDVADALTDRHWLNEQVLTLQTTQSVQLERARLAKLRYDSGAAAFLEVLDAERDLLDVEQQLVQRRRELLSSQVALYNALGGGQAAIALSAASPKPERNAQ
ncbi:efflux transporter outer membrane subunit [Pseudomonas typographi]|uniref:efflux transporter outer membrane subunit n=1 Tax=Pseudomonas typographi TaxID=2715964 RepID=UPI003B831E6A